MYFSGKLQTVEIPQLFVSLMKSVSVLIFAKSTSKASRNFWQSQGDFDVYMSPAAKKLKYKGHNSDLLTD